MIIIGLIAEYNQKWCVRLTFELEVIIMLINPCGHITSLKLYITDIMAKRTPQRLFPVTRDENGTLTNHVIRYKV